jgi:hypothetical protein
MKRNKSKKERRIQNKKMGARRRGKNIFLLNSELYVEGWGY